MEFLGYLVGMVLGFLILFGVTALYSRRLTRSLLREIDAANERSRQRIREMERMIQQMENPETVDASDKSVHVKRGEG